MKVFRLCRKDEVLQILTQRSLENLGKYGVNNKKNTHTYNEKIKYLHFCFFAILQPQVPCGLLHVLQNSSGYP